MRKAATALVAVALVLVSSGSPQAAAAETDPEALAGLAAVRTATAGFHDVAQALADGYVPASPCQEDPALGGMGIHYANFGLASDLTVEATTPEVLLYVPAGEGMRLVAVEYFVPALANTPYGPAPWFGQIAPPFGFFNPAPTVLGQTFNGPMAGHTPDMPWHYDLHAWVWQANLAGVFANFNPTVSCPEGGGR